MSDSTLVSPNAAYVQNTRDKEELSEYSIPEPDSNANDGDDEDDG